MLGRKPSDISRISHIDDLPALPVPVVRTAEDRDMHDRVFCRTWSASAMSPAAITLGPAAASPASGFARQGARYCLDASMFRVIDMNDSHMTISKFRR
jgi:hypothetical protein